MRQRGGVFKNEIRNNNNDNNSDSNDANNSDNENNTNVESNNSDSDVLQDNYGIIDMYENNIGNINNQPMFKFYQQYTSWNYEQLMIELSNNVWFACKLDDIDEERNLLMLQCPGHKKENRKMNWIKKEVEKKLPKAKDLKNISKVMLAHNIDILKEELREIIAERDFIYEENKKLTKENLELLKRCSL